MSYPQGPNRVPKSAEDRLLERLKSLEARLAGVERRGASATWTGSEVASHAATHQTGGADALSPADIGAATASALSSLQTTVNGLPTSYAETITGDSTETDFTINHDLGTRDCIVQIRENFSSFEGVQPADYSLEFTDADNIEVKWNTAPGTGDEYRILVIAL
jgi:hypothetical protein